MDEYDGEFHSKGLEMLISISLGHTSLYLLLQRESMPSKMIMNISDSPILQHNIENKTV